MANHVLEFASVSEAKSCVEREITELKGRLDTRLSQIFEGLHKIELDTTIDLSVDNEELERLRAYRVQTISIFGPNAPNIEIIDQKISDIESQPRNKSTDKPIKLNWNRNPLLVLISELGSMIPDLPTQGRDIKPLNTSKHLPKQPYNDVIVPQNLPTQTENKIIAKPAPTKTNDDVMVSKPPLSRKPQNVKPFHPINVQKSVSMYSEPMSATLVPNSKLIEDVELVISRQSSTPDQHKLWSEDQATFVENMYEDVDEPDDDSYCHMASEVSPPQRPPSPSPCLSKSSFPILDPVAKLSNFTPDLLLTEPIHNYEDVEFLPEGEVAHVAELERKAPTSWRLPRYPIIICCPEGPNRGQIMKPKAICVNRINGILFVAEKGNSRVQVFSSSGEHINFFVDKGSNKMNNPYGICIANNNAYVTQSSAHCVHIYTLNGAFVKKFGREGNSDGKFKLPSNITANPAKKQIYVCDTGNDRVQAFDFSNNFCRHFGVGQLLKPVDIDIDSGGKLVVLDRGPKCVHVFGLSGERLFSLVAFATYRQVINPLFLTLNKQDDIFLSDYARNCVFIFSMDGLLKGQIGEDGVFVEPRGLVVDNNGRLAVVSCNHTGCLQFYDL